MSLMASRAVEQRCMAMRWSSSIMNIPASFRMVSRPVKVVSPMASCRSLRQGYAELRKA